MNLAQKSLYHQIHPLKLLTDWATAFVAAYLSWDHRLGLALLVGLLPPVVASVGLIAWADLEPYAKSRLGRYVRSNMTRALQGIRLIGAAMLWTAAWFHSWLWMAGAIILVLGAWAWGMVRPAGSSSTAP